MEKLEAEMQYSLVIECLTVLEKIELPLVKVLQYLRNSFLSEHLIT